MSYRNYGGGFGYEPPINDPGPVGAALAHLADGQWRPYPLLQGAAGSLINPYNEALYSSAAEATGAVGAYEVLTPTQLNQRYGFNWPVGDDPVGQVDPDDDPDDATPVNPGHVEAGFFDQIKSTVDGIATNLAAQIGVDKQLVYIGGAGIVALVAYNALSGSGGKGRR